MITKRAVLFKFHEPPGDHDPQEAPSVDLVIGLTRKDAEGLWIPNTTHDRWDASHPQRHTELLTAPPKDLRVFRARVIRLVKALVANDGDDAVVISFNVEALAYYFVTEIAATLSDAL